MGVWSMPLASSFIAFCFPVTLSFPLSDVLFTHVYSLLIRFSMPYYVCVMTILCNLSLLVFPCTDRPNYSAVLLLVTNHNLFLTDWLSVSSTNLQVYCTGSTCVTTIFILWSIGLHIYTNAQSFVPARCSS